MIIVANCSPPAVVRQSEHARQSAHIARTWQLERHPKLVGETRRLFIEAVNHHDDGWTAWEASPKRRPDGSPLNFTDVPAHEHAAIWRRSVDLATLRHPYVGILVAKHARSLYRHYIDHTAETPARDPADEAAAIALLSFLDDAITRLSRNLQSQGLAWRHAIEHIDHHAALLSMFDAITLMMLSGIPRADSVQTESFRWQIRWHDSERRAAISPWPMHEPEVVVRFTTIDGRSIDWRLAAAD